jgi:hypothetical protein
MPAKTGSIMNDVWHGDWISLEFKLCPVRCPTYRLICRDIFLEINGLLGAPTAPEKRMGTLLIAVARHARWIAAADPTAQGARVSQNRAGSRRLIGADRSHHTIRATQGKPY